MGLGLSGAYGAAGAQKALTDLQDRAIEEQIRRAAEAQREFQNSIALRQIAEQEASGGVNRQRIAGLTRIADADEGRTATEFNQKQQVISGLSPTSRALAFLPNLNYGDVASPDEMRARAIAEGIAKGAATEAAFNAGGRSVLEQTEGPKGIQTQSRLRLIGAQSAADLAQARQLATMKADTPSFGDEYKAERSRRVVESVDDLMTQVSPWTVGYGSVLAALPETDARNFEQKLNTLKGNIAFNELTEMRAASKTGGALGAVSNKEIGLLESALGALDTKQRPEHFKEQLAKIKASIERWNAAKSGGAPNTSAPTAAPVEWVIVNGQLVRKGG